MTKNEFNSLLREYVRNNLSPTQEEQDLVSNIYSSFQKVLAQNCIQIGSYPRCTSIRPIHDLDILYIAGNYDPNNPDPREILDSLEGKIDSEFENPTEYHIEISTQSHSVTISFKDSQGEAISVDVVPAFISGEKNSYGEDIFRVPEILNEGHAKRKDLYEQFSKTKKSEQEWWIKSDPRGYISVNSELNANPDFRKTVKFVKKWSKNHKDEVEEFKLKSFHIEQMVVGIFQRNTNIEIFDALFELYTNLQPSLEMAQIPDRADKNRMVDEYVNSLAPEKRKLIASAKDCFLIKLENFSSDSTVEELLKACFQDRIESEEFLFDSKIPVLIDESIKISIVGEAQERDGNFPKKILDKLGLIDVDRHIKFHAVGNESAIFDLLKWKVKNDNSCDEPRGEITDHATKNDPEHTKYDGSHYVECFAIINGVCVSRARQDVVLNNPFNRLMERTRGNGA